MLLNGKELLLSGTADLPDLFPAKQSGTLLLEPACCAFLVVERGGKYTRQKTGDEKIRRLFLYAWTCRSCRRSRRNAKNEASLILPGKGRHNSGAYSAGPAGWQR